MSELKDLQVKFARKIAVLELVAFEMGFEVTNGHALRCADCKVGIKNSLHKLKLAKDVLLHKDGRYLTSTEDYAPLGKVWEVMGGSWGGRFGDGNHFSMQYGNYK